MSDDQKTPEQIDAEEAAAKRAKEATLQAEREQFRAKLASDFRERTQLIVKQSDAAVAGWGEDPLKLVYEKDVLEAMQASMEATGILVMGATAKIGILVEFVTAAFPKEKQEHIKASLVALMKIADEELVKIQATYRD